jgi:CMP-N-acetylneuraminic acid synthetase
MNIAMIPARMGSQRLKQKNLRELGGIPLITRAIRKCIACGAFDEIWVNSEHPRFGEIAEEEGVLFHLRPPELANNVATSEQFVHQFLKGHACDYLFQVHTIAPLLTTREVVGFVQTMLSSDYDVLLSVVNEQIECAIDGKPINFTFDHKTNSQELTAVQRVTWSITGWRAATYVAAHEAGRCATYAGRVGFHPVSRLAGHIIKTEEDLRIAEALLAALDTDIAEEQ